MLMEMFTSPAFRRRMEDKANDHKKENDPAEEGEHAYDCGMDK